MSEQDTTEQADKLVSEIMGKPAPVDTERFVDKTLAPLERELEVDKETVERLTSPKRKKKESDPDGVDAISFEDKKSFYVAIMFGNGCVTWDLPIGNTHANKALGIKPQTATFRSKSGAEVEVHDKIQSAIRQDTTRDLQDNINLSHRTNLFLQLLRYGEMTFSPPQPAKEGESLDPAVVQAYVDACVRRMSGVAMANALATLAQFERRIVNCIIAVQNGTFMKADR